MKFGLNISRKVNQEQKYKANRQNFQYAPVNGESRNKGLGP